MEDLDLGPIQKKILEQSFNLDDTQRRKKVVMRIEAIGAVLFSVAAFVIQSWWVITGVALIYILVTIFEKATYSDAILEYKCLIQKMKKRIEELEGECK